MAIQIYIYIHIKDLKKYGKVVDTYSWTVRWLRLGWRGFIVEALRDKPTRDVWTDEIIILLVGKPTGALDFLFKRSVVETKTMRNLEKLKA